MKKARQASQVTTLSRGDLVRDARNPRRLGTVDGVSISRTWVLWHWSGRVECVPSDHLRVVIRYRHMGKERYHD